MFLVKTTIVLALMSCIFAINCSTNPDEDTTINCSIQRRCSFIEDIVWATDNTQCYLFRNACLFANEVCSRRDQNQDELKVVTQEECKKLCRDACTKEYVPVCGDYNNESKTFSNKCEFYKYSCENNKSYLFVNEGECNQAVPA